MSAEAPALAGRYELGEEIGRGGSARVHRAWDRECRCEVAIKILPFDVDAVAARRRRHEIELLASLDHPALVALLDTVDDERAAYLVMELMGGGTLRDRMRAGALELPEVRAIASDAALALDHIHAAGIVHRDVKPANLLLPAPGTAGPVVKLSDFGIAKLLDLQATRSTGVIGTANYLSPEQAEGRVASPSTDIYSLGLTLLEACTGRTVFPGSIAESVAARLLRDPEVPSWLGAEWRSLLTAMLQRDPEARPSAAEVASRAALLPDAPVEDPTAEMTFTAPLTPLAPAVRTTPARAVGARAIVAAAAVVLVAGTGVALAVTGAPARDALVGAASAPASSAPTPSASPRPTGGTLAVAAAHATNTAYRASDVQRTAAPARTSAPASRASAHAAAAPAPKPAPRSRPGHHRGKPAAHPGRGAPAKAEHAAPVKHGAPGGAGKGHGGKR